MTTVVSRSRIVRRPVDEVVALITDPEQLLPRLHEFGRFEHVGATTYDVFLDIGTIHVGGRVEITHPDVRSLAWHSVRGTTHTLELRAEEHPDGARLTMTLALTLFGLLTGQVAELLARPIMDRHVVAGLEQIRHGLEYG